MLSRGIGNSLNNRIISLGQSVEKLSKRIDNAVGTDLTNADVERMINNILPGVESLISETKTDLENNFKILNDMVVAEFSKLNSVIGDPCFYEICDSGNLVGAHLYGSTAPTPPVAIASFLSATDVIFFSSALYNSTHLLMIRVTLNLNQNDQYQGHTVQGRKMYDTSQQGSVYDASFPQSNLQILYSLGTDLNQFALDIHPELGLIFNGDARNDIPTILNPSTLQTTIESIVTSALGSLDLTAVDGFSDSIASQIASAIAEEINNANIDVSQIVADALASSISSAQLSSDDLEYLASLVGQGIATALSSASLSAEDEAALGELVSQALSISLSNASLSTADEAAILQLVTDGIAMALANASLSPEDEAALEQLVSNSLSILMSNISLSQEDEATIQAMLETTINDQMATLISNLNLASNSDFLTAVTNALNVPFDSTGKLNNHIIPTSNATFDLGNAENKIRHLFLSDNSLWVGDSHKISVDNGSLKIQQHNRKSVPQVVSELVLLTGESVTVNTVNSMSRNGPKSFTSLTEMQVQDWVDVANGVKDLYVTNLETQQAWPFKNTNGTVRDANFNDIFGYGNSSANSENLHEEQNGVKDPVQIINSSVTIDYSLHPFSVAFVTGPQTITVTNVPSGTDIHFQQDNVCTIHINNLQPIQSTSTSSLTLYRNSDGTEYLLRKTLTATMYGGGLPAQDLTSPEIVQTSFSSASRISIRFNEPMDATKGTIV